MEESPTISPLVRRIEYKSPQKENDRRSARTVTPTKIEEGRLLFAN
jgi:hypothetical protein